MKVTVYLNREGASAVQNHRQSRIGSRGLEGHQSLVIAKAKILATPVEHFMILETELPEWEGDLKERAAVGLGLRKKSARFIKRVEITE